MPIVSFVNYHRLKPEYKKRLTKLLDETISATNPLWEYWIDVGWQEENGKFQDFPIYRIVAAIDERKCLHVEVLMDIVFHADSGGVLTPYALYAGESGGVDIMKVGTAENNSNSNNTNRNNIAKYYLDAKPVKRKRGNFGTWKSSLYTKPVSVFLDMDFLIDPNIKQANDFYTQFAYHLYLAWKHMKPLFEDAHATLPLVQKAEILFFARSKSSKEVKVPTSNSAHDNKTNVKKTPTSFGNRNGRRVVRTDRIIKDGKCETHAVYEEVDGPGEYIVKRLPGDKFKYYSVDNIGRCKAWQ